MKIDKKCPFLLEIKKWAKPLSRKQLIESVDKYVYESLSWDSKEDLIETLIDVYKNGWKSPTYNKMSKNQLIEHLYVNIDEDYFETIK